MSPRASRALLVFLIYVFMGPPVGALSFGVLLTAVSAFTEPGIGLTFIYASIILLPLAYAVGGVQAAVVGAAAALSTWRHGSVAPWLPLGVALVTAGFHVARAHEDWLTSGILVAVHLAAAFGCWLIVRRLP